MAPTVSQKIPFLFTYGTPKYFWIVPLVFLAAVIILNFLKVIKSILVSIIIALIIAGVVAYYLLNFWSPPNIYF